jgi:hypothetical protein
MAPGRDALPRELRLEQRRPEPVDGPDIAILGDVSLWPGRLARFLGAQLRANRARGAGWLVVRATPRPDAHPVSGRAADRVRRIPAGVVVRIARYDGRYTAGSSEAGVGRGISEMKRSTPAAAAGVGPEHGNPARVAAVHESTSTG